MSSSSLEPAQFVKSFFERSGVASGSGLGREYMYLVHAIYTLVCVDGLDASKLSTGEHLARRVLQIEKAVKIAPGKPAFDGLQSYMKHADGATGTLHTPVFDKYLAGVQRDEALIMKNQRLSVEETEAAGKKKNNNKKEKGDTDAD